MLSDAMKRKINRQNIFFEIHCNFDLHIWPPVWFYLLLRFIFVSAKISGFKDVDVNILVVYSHIIPVFRHFPSTGYLLTNLSFDFISVGIFQYR